VLVGLAKTTPGRTARRIPVGATLVRRAGLKEWTVRTCLDRLE
jgi:hypothetical protein